MANTDLPVGWTRWHDRPDDILVLTFRPDVFDGSTFPAACLPTIAVKPERSRGRRGRPQPTGHGGTWCAELSVEPDMVLDRRTTPDRDAAVEAGRAMAAAFVGGEYDLPDVDRASDGSYIDRLATLIRKEE